MTVTGTHTETTIDATVDLMVNAKEIIVVPGYGLAVAQGQHALSEVAKFLKTKNIRMRFAIHPVAGRMPG